MKFSPGDLNAFYTGDQVLRESIRQDVLVERYADLQQELKDIENLLDITEEEKAETLFEINEILFDLIESLVPEIVENDESANDEEDGDVVEEEEDPRQQRKNRMKDREKQALKLQRDKEQLIRAKSNIRTARLATQSTSATPQQKDKARITLRKARSGLSQVKQQSRTSPQ